MHSVVAESPVAPLVDGQKRRHSWTAVDDLDAGAGAQEGRGRLFNCAVAWQTDSRYVLRNRHDDSRSGELSTAGASCGCDCGCSCGGSCGRG